MNDLNMLMRDQARAGLQTELDAAVTNGDTEAARKVTDKIAQLAVSTAPKAPPYGNEEIKAELNKLDWFGVDPKKSARVIELGKHMDPKKFGSAELFAAALVKAVDEETKPTGGTTAEGEDDGAAEGEDDDKGKEAAADEKKPRRTDGPGEGDATNRTTSRRATSGPWTKMTDAPADVQKEVKRSVERFVGAHATKEQRETFITKALEGHYAAAQRKAGKK